MSPKYLAGQKVDRARFRFPEVTGGWGSHCSVQHWIREFVNWPSPVSSFWKTVRSPQQLHLIDTSTKGFEKGSTVCKGLNCTRMMTMAARKRGKKEKRRGWWGPGAPGGGDGNGGVWDLREGQTRKEMRMREVEPHLRRELVENEWPGWEYSGGGWEGTMLAGTCWLMTSSSHLAGWPCLRNAGSWKIRAAHFCLIVPPPPPALMLWQIMKYGKIRNAHCKKCAGFTWQLTSESN